MVEINKSALCSSLLGSSLLVGTMCANASAAGQMLKFQLVTYVDEIKVVDAPDAGGHVLGTGDAHGVAVFEDNRIAEKSFVFSFEATKEGETAYGYGTYTFDDGSSITARFEDTTDADGAVAGKYLVLGGTGQYDGAKGTGWYEKAKEPWEKGLSLERRV